MSEYLGYAKAQRSLLGTPLWESSYQVTVYFYCLLSASHTYYRGLEPGQFYTSAPAIAREVHQSRNGVRIQLKRLEALGMIRAERCDRGLLITVIDQENACGAAPPEGQDISSGQEDEAAPSEEHRSPSARKPEGHRLVSRGHHVVSRGHTVTPTGHDTASAPGHPIIPRGHTVTPRGHSLAPTGQPVAPIGSMVDPTQEYKEQEKKKEKDKQEQQEPLSYSPRGPEVPAAPEDPEEGERFEEFWEAYPKKQARRFALRAWQKLNPDRALCDRIMEGLRRWKASAEWQRDYSGKDAEAMARFLALYGSDEEDRETG